ncbi:MAG: ABC transporter permease [Verrucomicrobiales bacterium]
MTDSTTGSRTLSRLRPGESLGLVAVLGVVIVVFSLLAKNFFSAATFHQIANQVPALTIVAVGMTFVVLTRGIDLSVGSVMALAGSVLGLAMVDAKLPLLLALPLAMVAGALCGFANGWVSVRFGLPSFIVTLGMMQIARGLAYLATDSQTRYIGKPVEWLGAPLGGLGLSPAILLAILLVAIGQLVLRSTVFGRHVLVVGANEEAAIYSGIRTSPVRIAVFVIAGALAGLAAAFDSSKMGAVDPNAGAGLELSAIAAVVVGGTSLMGGRGSVTGSFLGVLIIATLGAGLNQLGASEPLKLLVTGLVIVSAVVGDAWRGKQGN